MKSIVRSSKVVLALSVCAFVIFVIKYPSENIKFYVFTNNTDNAIEFRASEKSYHESDKTDDSKTFTELLPGNEKINRSFIACKEKDNSFKIVQHGRYLLMRNYVKPLRHFNCFESITYSTHCDFTFLENLVPLLQRWEAPVSVALWAPRNYFDATIASILFLRNCHDTDSHLVRQFASFHIILETNFWPRNVPRDFSKVERDFVCPDSEPSPSFPLGRAFNSTYPVNVGRNLARDAALTHFVMASDIELYPNPGLVEQFFEMVLKDPDRHLRKNNVFVLPIFEVGRGEQVPGTKSSLIKMYHKRSAIWFHFKICPSCHSIPEADEWIKEDDETELRVFTTIKRQGRFDHWEPIFIGTNDEPFYDERLSWEGKSDKMTQAYVMCLLDYDFNVLSNAFLVHKPGFKDISEASRAELEMFNRNLIENQILPEIKASHGERKGCRIHR